MINVIFDNLQYYSIYENGIFIEGYDGYKIVEVGDGTSFVIYKEIIDNNEVERRFKIPKGYTAESFIKESVKLRNVFERQKFLFKALLDIESDLVECTEDELKSLCDAYYTMPQNYFQLVCINFTKTQLYLLAKEKILKSKAMSKN